MKTFLQRTISCLIIFVCLLACVSVKQVVNAADETISFKLDKTTTGKTSSSYVTSATTFNVGSVSYVVNNWNPSSLQIRGNQSTQTNLQSGANFYIHNTTEIPGNIKSITLKISSGTLVASKIFAQTSSNVITNQTSSNSKVATSGNNLVTWTFDEPSKFFAIGFQKGATSGTVISSSLEIVYENATVIENSQTKFEKLNTFSSLNLNYIKNEVESNSVVTWDLVQDVSSLNVGDEIVISAASSNYAISNTDKTNNRDGVLIEKNGNQIKIDDTVQIISLENGKVANTFAFKTEEGYLYAASSSNNYLKTKSTLDDNGSWSIAINSGIATIKSQGSYSRNVIRYNPNNGSPLFSCYSSGQEDVSIYKKTVSSGLATEYIIKENSVSLRFGTLVPAEIYEDLLSQGYKFGVNFVSGSNNKDFLCDNIESVTVDGIDYYQYAVVIKNVPATAYNEMFTATCFAELNGEQVKMNSKTHSVVSILTAYVEMAESSEEYYGSLDKDLMAGLLTAANK